MEPERKSASNEVERTDILSIKCMNFEINRFENCFSMKPVCVCVNLKRFQFSIRSKLIANQLHNLFRYEIRKRSLHEGVTLILFPLFDTGNDGKTVLKVRASSSINQLSNFGVWEDHLLCKNSILSKILASGRHLCIVSHFSLSFSCFSMKDTTKIFKLH